MGWATASRQNKNAMPPGKTQEPAGICTLHVLHAVLLTQLLEPKSGF